MTDDLVKRLRESAQAWDNEGECGLATLEREAAYCIKDQQKRIEQLETALRFYAQSSTYQHMGVQMSGTSTRPCDTDMGTRARAALAGEKKDG
jgi:hypothetical protein